MTNRERAVVLLSGGLDSTVCAAWGQNNGFDIYALTIDYGQRNSCELQAARRVANSLGVIKHVFISVDLSAIGGSTLTSNGDIHDIPNMYVPARNTIFLSLALGYAEVVKADHIILGVNTSDNSFPDTRPEYLDAFINMARLATKDSKIQFHVPLINLEKWQIVKMGFSLHVDFSHTHTCYTPTVDNKSCGECSACVIRINGFRQAGLIDTLEYV
jgi:7-cyano-7-deazaguanine synthase